MGAVGCIGSTALNRGHTVGRVCYPTYGRRIANPPYIWGYNDYSIDVLGATTVKCGATGSWNHRNSPHFIVDLRMGAS